MKRVTYLFGAGASRNAVPIVGELNESMASLLSKLKYKFEIDLDAILSVGSNPVVTNSLIREFIHDFQWLINSSQKHQSIDTLAKKLYIQGEFEDLKKLKTILSFYLIIVQSAGNADSRYDSFFASILKDTYLKFPENLKILSWNYDYQIEKSYAEYSRDYRFDSCHTLLNMKSKNSRGSSFDTDRFGVIKLNGTGSFMLDTDGNGTWNYVQKVNSEYNNELLYTLLENYASLHHILKTKEKVIPSLSFAWEDYDVDKPILKKAIEFTKATEILVVIGYSFPFFNRLVDRDIIKSMNLEKVYFQSPDAEDLRERFLAIRDDIKNENLILRKDVAQFVFPNEF